MRLGVFIDGFNLYYGKLKGTNLRWLDLAQFSEAIKPVGTRVSGIKYFTARVATLPGNSGGTAQRQQIYLRAITSCCPSVTVIFGRYSVHAKVMRLVTPNSTIARSLANNGGRGICRINSHLYQSDPNWTAEPGPPVHVVKPEEKGSDVNLGAHLLNDAWKREFDVAAVVSNDSDLSEPIRLVTSELGIPVYVFSPFPTVTNDLRNSLIDPRHAKLILPAAVRNSQLPLNIPGTNLSCPVQWR